MEQQSRTVDLYQHPLRDEPHPPNLEILGHMTGPS